LALANTQTHKNIDVLFKAFQSADLSGSQLVLFGPASRRDFEDLGSKVPANVIFAGRVSDEELSGLMTSAGALAFPSLTEGFGLPPLEAMALGCPVVVAPCGALPEVCGDAAFYADPNKPDEWSAKLLQVMKDETVRSLQISKGFERSSKYTWKRSAQLLLASIDLANVPDG